MFIRWLNNRVFGTELPKTKKKSSDPKTVRKSDGLLDLVHEAVKAEAADLSALLRSGLPNARRQRRRQAVKKKVAAAIDPAFDEETLVDEITERITDASEVDPYYQRLFADDK
jgi:hypothetical protein